MKGKKTIGNIRSYFEEVFEDVQCYPVTKMMSSTRMKKLLNLTIRPGDLTFFLSYSVEWFSSYFIKIAFLEQV